MFNTCKFSQEADQHQHQLLYIGACEDKAGVSNVTQDPLACTTPYSAPILLICIFCNICKTKVNKRPLLYKMCATWNDKSRACINSLY